MKVQISSSILQEIQGLTSAGRIHTRVGSTTPGADFKLPDTVKAVLLANSGKTFTISEIDVKGCKPRGQNIMVKGPQDVGDAKTTRSSIPTGKFDTVVLVSGKFAGVNEEITFKTTLAEIASADDKGQIVIEAQILGEVLNDLGEVTKPGNIWVHSNTAASAEMQVEMLEKLTKSTSKVPDVKV